MTVYKLYGATVQDNVANLDIQEDGIIEGCLMSMGPDLDADGENMMMEVSFSSVSGFTNNDTRASLCGCRSQNGLLTSGAINCAINLYVPMNTPVSAGERMYLHTNGTAASLGWAAVWIYVADSRNRISDRERRVRRGGPA